MCLFAVTRIPCLIWKFRWQAEVKICVTDNLLRREKLQPSVWKYLVKGICPPSNWHINYDLLKRKFSYDFFSMFVWTTIIFIIIIIIVIFVCVDISSSLLLTWNVLRLLWIRRKFLRKILNSYQTTRRDTAEDGSVLLAVVAYLWYLLPRNMRNSHVKQGLFQ